jgi:DNA-binding response OmpR family regulator
MTETGTILVVDDDTELRDGLTALLDQHGYRTLAADDGLLASQLIDQHRPDLVILDMMMPRWGGLAVLERFCGKSGAPPFIMMTANDGAKHKGYAEQLGVVDYLQKPFTMNRLLDRVGKIVPAPSAVQEDSPASVVRCRCAACGARIKAPVHMLRQTRTCPGCKRQMVISPAPPEDEGPMLVK